jgi:hypothetical protein
MMHADGYSCDGFSLVEWLLGGSKDWMVFQTAFLA